MGQVMTSAQSLVDYIEQNDLLLQMSHVQADLILRELKEANKQLNRDEHQLFITTGDSRKKQCVTIDELIDIICEKNYEKIVEARQKNRQTYGVEQYLSSAKKLLTLQQQEQLLNDLFKQTIYGRDMIQVVQQQVVLANKMKRNHTR